MGEPFPGPFLWQQQDIDALLSEPSPLGIQDLPLDPTPQLAAGLFWDPATSCGFPAVGPAAAAAAAGPPGPLLPGSLNDAPVLASSGSEPGSTTNSTDEKLERARERNRQKQARLRERRKEQRQQLEEQHASAVADLERERQLNASLRQTGQVLQAVQKTKDTAVQILESTAEPSLRQQQGAGAGLGPQHSQQGEQRSGSSSGGGGSSHQGAAFMQQLYELEYPRRVELCCRMMRGSNVQHLLPLQDDKECSVDGFSLDLQVRQQLGQQMVAAHPQVLDALCCMTPELVIKEWGEFGAYAAETIALLDGGEIGEAEAEERLHPAIMYEAIQAALLLRVKPECNRQLLAHTKLPGESEEEARQRWRKVAVSMGVSYEQAVQLVPHYRAYCASLAQLGAESAALMATLQDIQQRLKQQLLLLDQGLSQQMQDYLALLEVTGKLEQHPDTATLVLLDFMRMAGHEITVLQKVRMMAMCRPLHPDVVCIVREGLDYFGLLESATGDAPIPPTIPPGSEAAAAAAAAAAAGKVAEDAEAAATAQP